LRHSRSLEDFALPSKHYEDGGKKKKRSGPSERAATIATHHRQISNPIPIPHQSGIDRWLASESSLNAPAFIQAGPNAVRPSNPVISVEQPSDSMDSYYATSSHTLDKFPLPPGSRDFKKDQVLQRRAPEYHERSKPLVSKQTRDPIAMHATVRERGAMAIDKGPSLPQVPQGWSFVQPQHIVPRNSPGWESDDDDDDYNPAYHTYHGQQSYPQIRPTQPLIIRKHMNSKPPPQAPRSGAGTTTLASNTAVKTHGPPPAKDRTPKQDMSKATIPDIHRSASDTSHYRKNTIYENPRRPPLKPLPGTSVPAGAAVATSGNTTLHARTQSAQAAYDTMPVAPRQQQSPSPSKRREQQQQQSQKTAWYRPSAGRQSPTALLRSGPVSHKPVIVKNKTKHPDYSGSFFED
jgi:hypothetical protein